MTLRGSTAFQACIATAERALAPEHSTPTTSSNPDGRITLPNDGGFLTVLTDFGTKRLLAFLDLEEQTGNAKTLAEPNLLAGNKDTATFLAGGEIPVPILQPGNGQNQVSIQYKEFGVRLKFVAEIFSDSLIKLNVTPEVSSLDFVNGIVISGFRIPAFRTRRFPLLWMFAGIRA